MTPMAKNNYQSMSPAARERAKAYQRKPEQIARRSERNKARRAFEKENGDLPTDKHVHDTGQHKGGGRLVAMNAKDNLGHPDKDIHGGKGSRERGSRRSKAVVSALRRD